MLLDIIIEIFINYNICMYDTLLYYAHLILRSWNLYLYIQE